MAAKNIFQREFGKITFVLFLALLCVTVYQNSLANPFLMDDHALLTRNPAINDWGFLQFIQGHLPPSTYTYFRPLMHLFNVIPYRLFGPDPFAFHLFNISLLILCGTAVYELILKIFSDRRLAFWSSILFCVHPINGILVNYSNASGFSVMITAMALSMYYFAASFQNERPKLFIGLSLLFYFIAMLFHETALFLPLYMLCLLRFTSLPSSGRKPLKAFFPYLIAAVIFLLLRQTATVSVGTYLERIGFHQLSFVEFLGVFGTLLKFYIQDLLLLDITVLMRAVDVDALSLRPILGLFGFITIALVLLYTHWKQNERSLGLSWMLFGLLPLFLAAFSRPDEGVIYQPHWMFFPTLGFCLLICGSVMTLQKRFALSFTVLCLTLLAFTLSSMVHNELWRDERRYLRTILARSPRLPVASYWLADAEYRSGNSVLARVIYRSALRGRPRDWMAHVNIAAIDMDWGRLDSAKAHLQQALALNPDGAEIYANIGAIHVLENRMEDAKRAFEKAIALDYYQINAWKNLIWLYHQDGQQAKTDFLEQELESIIGKN